MPQTSGRFGQNYNSVPQWENPDYMPSSILLCNWPVLRRQLLQQWTLLTASELDITGPNCRRIASLISHKYSVAPTAVENYLRNFERTMPLL
jgi:hypothetical protein